MKTKNMLNEWKSFLLNEHKSFSLDEIIQTILRSKRSKQDLVYLKNFWNSNRFITKYTQVIQNEIKNTREPVKEILDVCKLHYFKVYQSAGPNLKDQIGSGNISIDELRKQVDAKSSFNKNEVRQECKYSNGRPVVGNYQDFDVVYSEADYIVIEPKTIQGSIAWAHGKPDGSEETDQKRRVGWCTGVSTANNMFPNYAGNLHMFYVINTDYDNDNSADRRVCLSFRIEDEKPVLNEKGNSTVNALNREIKNVESIKSQKFYQDILKALEGRKQTSFAEIYSKITVSQLKRTIAQMKSQKIDENVMQAEMKNYIHYAVSDDVLLFFLNDEKYEKDIANKVCDDSEQFNVVLKKVLEKDNLLPIVAKKTSDQSIINFLKTKNLNNVNYELAHNINVSESDRNELGKKIISSYDNFNKGTPIKDLIGFVQFLDKSYEKMSEGKGLYKSVPYDSLEDIYYLLFIENDVDEVVANTHESYGSSGYKKVMYCNRILQIKDSYPELFSQNIDFWLDILINNFSDAVNLSQFIYEIKDLNDSQFNKIFNMSQQIKSNEYKYYDLIKYLYSCNLSVKQSEKVKEAIAAARDDFTRDLLSNILRDLTNNDYDYNSSNDLLSEKIKASLELFNISNESQKSFLAIEAQNQLKEHCPELISNYLQDSVPLYMKLLTDEYLNLTFEEYSKLFQEANFDSFVEEYYDVENEEEALYEKYPEFLEGFLYCNIVKENPEGVYDLFKSVGIDLSDNHSIWSIWFFDIMSVGYTSIEEMFEDLPYLKPIFGRHINLDESLLKKYISLMLS